MLDTCTRFADVHNFLFNSSKTKCMFIDRSCSQLHSNVQFMDIPVEFVNSVDLLGVLLYADLINNHIHRNVQKLYCNVNRVLFDFKDIPSRVGVKYSTCTWYLYLSTYLSVLDVLEYLVYGNAKVLVLVLVLDQKVLGTYK